MKNIQLFLGLFLLLFLASCSKKAYPETAEVTLIDGNNQGTVTVKAFGYGNNKYDAEVDAFRTALNTIFYTGFPGNDLVQDLRSPMYETMPKTESTFFQKFYTDKKYLTFVTAQLPIVEQPKRIKSKTLELRGKLCVEKQFTLNYRALRDYLLDQNQIRKGFSY